MDGNIRNNNTQKHAGRIIHFTFLYCPVSLFVVYVPHFCFDSLRRVLFYHPLIFFSTSLESVAFVFCVQLVCLGQHCWSFTPFFLAFSRFSSPVWHLLCFVVLRLAGSHPCCVRVESLSLVGVGLAGLAWFYTLFFGLDHICCCSCLVLSVHGMGAGTRGILITWLHLGILTDDNTRASRRARWIIYAFPYSQATLDPGSLCFVVGT